MSPRSKAVTICVEVGKQKIFASALDWPGWCRAARTESGALEALSDYATRYAAVATHAGIDFPALTDHKFAVVERLAGTTTTDFGAPDVIAEADRLPLAAQAAARLAGLVAAVWAVFDEVVVHSPAQLRKGPRGGGRDRDAMIAHVLAAESAYARKLGIQHKAPGIDDVSAIEVLREDIAAVLATSSNGEPLVAHGWPVRYAARRIAWHVLDHAWEMQDRAEPPAR